MAVLSVVNQQNCSGCRSCMLACSFFLTKEKEFSLSKARIKVKPVGGQNIFKTVVLEDCTGCGKCVPFCQYGVLARGEEGV